MTTSRPRQSHRRHTARARDPHRLRRARRAGGRRSVRRSQGSDRRLRHAVGRPTSTEATAIAQQHPGLPYGLEIEVRRLADSCHLGVGHREPRRARLTCRDRPELCLTTIAPAAARGAAAPAQLVENFFRHETGRLHGALIRLLGVQNLALAEDVAQEAMLRALRTWSMGGMSRKILRPGSRAWR